LGKGIYCPEKGIKDDSVTVWERGEKEISTKKPQTIVQWSRLALFSEIEGSP